MPVMDRSRRNKKQESHCDSQADKPEPRFCIWISHLNIKSSAFMSWRLCASILSSVVFTFSRAAAIISISPQGSDAEGAGSTRGGEPSGEDILRLIQIPFKRRRVCRKSRLLVKCNHGECESLIPMPETQSAFHPRAQRTLSIAMTVNNPDRSPLGIDGRDVAQLQPAFFRLTAQPRHTRGARAGK